MLLKAIHPTVNFPQLPGLSGFALRLFLPLLIIYLIPAEEDFFQNLFQSEGIYRIIQCAWSFRFSWITSLKKAGLCSLVFGAEECLQEVLLALLF